MAYGWKKMRSCSFLLVQFQDHPSNWCGNSGGTFPRHISGLKSREKINKLNQNLP